MDVVYDPANSLYRPTPRTLLAVLRQRKRILVPPRPLPLHLLPHRLARQFRHPAPHRRQVPVPAPRARVHPLVRSHPAPCLAREVPSLRPRHEQRLPAAPRPAALPRQAHKGNSSSCVGGSEPAHDTSTTPHGASSGRIRAQAAALTRARSSRKNVCAFRRPQRSSTIHARTASVGTGAAVAFLLDALVLPTECRHDLRLREDVSLRPARVDPPSVAPKPPHRPLPFHVEPPVRSNAARGARLPSSPSRLVAAPHVTPSRPPSQAPRSPYKRQMGPAGATPDHPPSLTDGTRGASPRYRRSPTLSAQPSGGTRANTPRYPPREAATGPYRSEGRPPYTLPHAPGIADRPAAA